jgi:hypothetical protein
VICSEAFAGWQLETVPSSARPIRITVLSSNAQVGAVIKGLVTVPQSLGLAMLLDSQRITRQVEGQILLRCLKGLTHDGIAVGGEDQFAARRDWPAF